MSSENTRRIGEKIGYVTVAARHKKLVQFIQTGPGHAGQDRKENGSGSSCASPKKHALKEQCKETEFQQVQHLVLEVEKRLGQRRGGQG